MAEKKLKEVQKQIEEIVNEINQKIDELGSYSNQLYENLNKIQQQFEAIRNAPIERQRKYKNLKNIRLNWRQQVEKIESNFKETMVKSAGGGAVAAGAGVAVAALGPSAAMGIATTFGVASTGTAISTLTGAAATNAALAWIGGGALAAGGGGMAAGTAFLALAGPIGVGIAGIAIAGSGLFWLKTKAEKEQLENIFLLVAERDWCLYKQTIVDLNERMQRIQEDSQRLTAAIRVIPTFGIDYDRMTEKQQVQLGTYVNLMEASTKLLVDSIDGVKPKYTEENFNKFLSEMPVDCQAYYRKNEKVIIALANQFYKIPLAEKDQALLVKNFKNNKEFLAGMGMEKKEFDIEIMKAVESCLRKI